MGNVPSLEDPKELEEGDQADDRADVGDAGHDGSEFAASTARTGQERNKEEDDEERKVEDDRAERDHDDPQQAVHRRVRERLDEEVRDGEDDGQSERRQDLVDHDRLPPRTRRVGRQLLARVADALLLEAGDLGPRETAVPDPRVGVRARVAAAHPTEELAVVDDKVAERELVRVEEERRDAQGDDRDPEVDDCRVTDSISFERKRGRTPVKLDAL